MGSAERLWLWGRRRPLIAGLAGAAAALLLLAGILTAFSLSKSREAADVRGSLKTAEGDLENANKEKERQEVLARQADDDRLRQVILTRHAQEKRRQADNDRLRQAALAKDAEGKRLKEETQRHQAEEDARRLRLAQLEQEKRARSAGAGAP